MSLAHVRADLAHVAPSHAIDVLRTQIAPDATDAELLYFGQVCTSLDLSPFAGQIVLIGRWDKRLGRKVHRHQITVDGRRLLAVRTGQLRGIEGPVWSGPRNEAGELVWQDVWDDDTPPYCARVLVHRAGWVKPANGTAKWSEFAVYQRGKDGSEYLSDMWQRMPSHMLGKVAESLALRRAFADVITPDAVGSFEAEALDVVEIVEAEAATAAEDRSGGEAGVREKPAGSEPGPSSPPAALPFDGDAVAERRRADHVCVLCGGELTGPVRLHDTGYAHKGECPQ